MQSSKSMAFFSYCRDNKEDFLMPIINRYYPIVKNLWDFYYDEKGLKPGDHIMKKLLDKMNQSDVIILLISSQYLKSPNCQRELYEAHELSETKRIIGIIIDDCDYKSIKALS